MTDAASRLREQRTRIDMKKMKSKHPDMAKHNQFEDDVVTMDGNSNYSRPGGAFSLKKPKKSFVKPGKYPRKGSILDDFEAVAN